MKKNTIEPMLASLFRQTVFDRFAARHEQCEVLAGANARTDRTAEVVREFFVRMQREAAGAGCTARVNEILRRGATMCGIVACTCQGKPLSEYAIPGGLLPGGVRSVRRPPHDTPETRSDGPENPELSSRAFFPLVGLIPTPGLALRPIFCAGATV